jgi:hypothetical protein
MLKKLLLPVLVLLSALGSLTMPGCKPREEELQTSGALEFSADTVKFDTVFTTLRTVTKRLWVYNRNPKGVNVDLVTLDQPAASPYTLIINGDLKQTATNLFIRGEDSLLVLVRAKLPDNGQNGAAKGYVLEEKLNFRTNGQDQRVLLRSFGQNIYLHEHVALACNSVWTNDRPHVLYDTVLVPANCTLTIKPGTRIYAHAGALLLVQGTLKVNSPADFTPGAGATDTISEKSAKRVRFAGDRSGEAQYATAPGQWTGIQLYPTSRGNIIRYATIQNASVGIWIVGNSNPASVQPDLTVQNSIIRYISGGSVNFAGVLSNRRGLPGAGILGIAGKVTVENTLFSDCYEYALLGYGGDYSMNYCTIANYAGAVRTTPSLGFTNVSAFDTTKRSVLTAKVYNSIVWGSIEDELVLANYKEYQNGPVDIRNTLLRTKLYSATTDVATKPGLAKPSLNNLISPDPLYPKFARYGAGAASNYSLGTGSPGRSRGAQQVLALPFLDRDLLNVPRPAARPDLGAYQTTP